MVVATTSKSPMYKWYVPEKMDQAFKTFMHGIEDEIENGEVTGNMNGAKETTKRGVSLKIMNLRGQRCELLKRCRL